MFRTLGSRIMGSRGLLRTRPCHKPPLSFLLLLRCGEFILNELCSYAPADVGHYGLVGMYAEKKHFLFAIALVAYPEMRW